MSKADDLLADAVVDAVSPGKGRPFPVKDRNDLVSRLEADGVVFDQPALSRVLAELIKQGRIVHRLGKGPDAGFSLPDVTPLDLIDSPRWGDGPILRLFG